MIIISYVCVILSLGLYSSHNRSIVRNTNTLKKDITLKDISFKFEHDREWKLAKQISRFAEIISRVYTSSTYTININIKTLNYL